MQCTPLLVVNTTHSYKIEQNGTISVHLNEQLLNFHTAINGLAGQAPMLLNPGNPSNSLFWFYFET